MIEQTIDSMLTVNTKIKREALQFLISIFAQLEKEQKQRIINFCSKYEANHTNAEWLSPNIPLLMKLIRQDEDLDTVSRAPFVTHLKKLKSSKDHFLRITFIDALKKYVEIGCLKDCRDMFKAEFSSYFNISELYQVEQLTQKIQKLQEQDKNRKESRGREGRKKSRNKEVGDDSQARKEPTPQLSKEEKDLERKRRRLKDYDADDYDIYCHLITEMPTVNFPSISTFSNFEFSFTNSECLI